MLVGIETDVRVCRARTQIVHLIVSITTRENFHHVLTVKNLGNTTCGTHLHSNLDEVNAVCSDQRVCSSMFSGGSKTRLTDALDTSILL